MNNSSLNMANGISAGALIAIAVVGLVIVVIAFWAQVNIIRRAGYSGWWVLILFVPVVSWIMILIFAFAQWPVTREVRYLREQLAQARAGQPGYGYPPGTPPYGAGYPQQ
jgi:uncharacterized membrane protein YhaH (DUF805 family)